MQKYFDEINHLYRLYIIHEECINVIILYFLNIKMSFPTLL